jgi:nitrite reductase (NADH) small subunit
VSEWVYVTDVGGVPLREGRRITHGTQVMALFHTPDGWFAIDNQCPHKKGPLADGITSGKTVYCPLHGWNIDLTSGKTLAGGEGHVKTYPVKVENDRVFVNL